MRTSISMIVITCLAAVFVSCNKENDDDQPQSFSWQINGGATQQSDTTSFLGLFNVYTLTGKKGTTSIFISTNSTNTGAYSFANANAGFGATVAGVQYNPTSGTIQISSNADNRLSGTFDAFLTNGGTSAFTISGSFSNIRY